MKKNDFESHLHILRRCPLFDRILDADLTRMLSCLGARIEHFDKKYTVFAEGTPAKYIGIILSGSVQIIQIDYYGNRNILFVARQSELFCEAFACAELAEMPVSAQANEDCDVMLIDCSHILHTCENACGFHQQLIFNLMKELASKNILLHQRAEIVSKRTTEEKLMTYLMLQAKKTGANSFDIPFDRQELADYLEVDRSGLSVQIGKLKKAGVIACRKNHFSLL